MNQLVVESGKNKIVIHYILIIVLLTFVYYIVYMSNIQKPTDTLAVFFSLFLAKFLSAFTVNKVSRTGDIISLHRTLKNIKINLNDIKSWKLLKLPDRKLLLDEKKRDFYVLSITTHTNNKIINYPLIGIKEKYNTKESLYYNLTDGILTTNNYIDENKEESGFFGLKYILWYIFI